MALINSPLQVAIRDEVENYLSIQGVEFTALQKEEVVDKLFNDDYLWQTFNEYMAEYVQDIVVRDKVEVKGWN